jgi:hypothetical protein
MLYLKNMRKKLLNISVTIKVGDTACWSIPYLWKTIKSQDKLKVD